MEIQNEIEEVVQIEEENDRGHMIAEEIVIVTEDVIVTGIEIVIEKDAEHDHVTESARDHVIGNIENKPLPFTIKISLLDCKNVFGSEMRFTRVLRGGSNWSAIPPEKLPPPQLWNKLIPGNSFIARDIFDRAFE